MSSHSFKRMRSRNDLWLLMSLALCWLVPASLATAQPASPNQVYVTGQVEKQGTLEIPAGETFTVCKVIALCGGLSDYADKLRIKLQRPNADGSSQTILVNMGEITDRNRLQKDPVVKPGDTIVVPMLPIYNDYHDK